MHPDEKIRALRKQMEEHQLDAWIVPSSDPHQSEYVAAHWQARAWLSGFRGSAGTLVVTRSRAGLWTDPRYHLRAAEELGGSGIELFRMGLPGTPSLVTWLRQELPPGAVVGFDGNGVSAADAGLLKEGLGLKSIGISHQFHLVDEIWQDRPELPDNPIFLLLEAFAGESRKEKLRRVRDRMQGSGVQFHLLCALDDIAWLLNIRGSDIDCNPVAVCYAVVDLQQLQLFIQPGKVPPEVKADLERDGVEFHPYGEIQRHLQQLPEGTGILIDPEKTSVMLRDLVPAHCPVKEGQSLPYPMKTIKNQTELAGIRQMHCRDGAALVRWLVWLEQHVAEDRLTEIGAAEKLAAFRREGEHFVGLSFPTICGYETHSAVGHYQTDPLRDPILHSRGILLVDSGAQYLDGTSDITRSISLGQANEAERLAFTLVLKCHIRLATATFPKGTTGAQLDALAREPLWRQGWNCRHGIGHGVGCFLNVHEGPIRFNEVNNTVLEPGMVISNEPGVYFEGQFGIRTENLMITVPGKSTSFGEFLAFETASLCPLDLALVERDLLDAGEIAWLNAYHGRVWERLSPLLAEHEQAWLRHATREI